MIDVNEVNNEIRRLEQQELTYQLCSKLADLYVVKDHLIPRETVTYSQAQSEFLEICTQVPIEVVLAVLDEHMECIKLLYPKEYSAVLSKIKKTTTIRDVY